jgi:hypothetical protein
MRAYLVGVLTVIALATLLIAYGLLAPQVSAAAMAVPTPQAGYVYAPNPYATRTVYEVPRAVPVVARAAQAPRITHVASSASHRDWTKTLLVVGGSTAAGAGIGGIVGGGKGAAIGAAIGGGASTLLEALRR